MFVKRSNRASAAIHDVWYRIRCCCASPPLARLFNTALPAAGALAAGDPLLALMATPPKPHTAALRAWAPLASQLLRPPAGAAPAAPGSVDVTAPSASSSPPAPGRRVAPVGAVLDGCAVTTVRRVGGLQELQQQVADNPSLWCDGSGAPAAWRVAAVTGPVSSVLAAAAYGNAGGGRPVLQAVLRAPRSAGH